EVLLALTLAWTLGPGHRRCRSRASRRWRLHGLVFLSRDFDIQFDDPGEAEKLGAGRLSLRVDVINRPGNQHGRVGKDNHEGGERDCCGEDSSTHGVTSRDASREMTDQVAGLTRGGS